MKIKSWLKVGPSQTLSEKYSRGLGIQKFMDPISNSVEEFSFFYGALTSVIVLPVTSDKKIVAIRQFRHAADDIFIELPGGNKNKRESSLSAARRELLEETGFRSGRMVELKTKKIWFDPSCVKNFYIPCLATDCRKISEPKLDAKEYIETIVVPVKDWLEMIKEGLVTDCKTISVTFLSLPYLGIDFKK